MGGSIQSNSRGTSPLVQKGSQHLEATQSKTEKAAGAIEKAKTAYSLGNEAYAAHERGQLSEFATDLTIDAAKKLALDKTGVSAVKQAVTSGKDTFDNLLNGDFEGAARSARDAVEAGSQVADLAGKAARSKPVRHALGKVAATRVGTRIATTSARIAERTLVHESAKLAGKAGARFVPGLNVVIAAVDAKHARDVYNDPNASTWQKGTAIATAVGSAASASNIPLVSQAGAVVSTVAAVAEGIDPKAAYDAAKKWISG